MYLICFDKDLFSHLIAANCKMISAKEDIKGNCLWIFERPETFSFSIENFKGKYFYTDSVRFDF